MSEEIDDSSFKDIDHKIIDVDKMKNAIRTDVSGQMNIMQSNDDIQSNL